MTRILLKSLKDYYPDNDFQETIQAPRERDDAPPLKKENIPSATAFYSDNPSEKDSHSISHLIALAMKDEENAKSHLRHYQDLDDSTDKIDGNALTLQSLSANQFDIYHRACEINQSVMKGLVRIAKKLGGNALVAEMIRAQEFKAIRQAVENEDKVTTLLILNALGDEDRADALQHVPKDWEIFHRGKKVKKDELWQDMGGSGDRWIAVTNKEAPDDSLRYESPYKFSRKLYDKILPEVRAACSLERQEYKAETVAFKLAVLFSNAEEIDRYLKLYAEKWKKDWQNASIIDAVSFDIPQRGLWDVTHWRNFILQNGPSAAENLCDAPKIEKAAEMLGRSLPKTLRDVRELTSFNSYERGYENPKFAMDASQYQIGEHHFDAALDHMKKNGIQSDQMPDIFIDGALIGHPDYYMVRLQPDDPMQCILGIINDHSMSILNAAGQYTVPHFVGSQYAAAYVLKKKTGGKVTSADCIIADSWAYITEQNNIVFDGIGSKESSTDSDGPISRIDKIFHSFLERFAYDVVDQHQISLASSNMRPEAETALPELVRNDAHAVFIEGVRLGDDKEWPEELRERAKQLNCEVSGQFFNPQDKLEGWMHNESQDHQLIITPRSHEKYQSEDIAAPSEDHVDELEREAKIYLEKTVEKLKSQYGIEVQAGFELETYAYDENGKRRSDFLDCGDVQISLQEAGLECTFEDENSDDNDGQYEAILPPSDPISAADRATAVREHLLKNANQFGAAHFDFDSVVEADDKNEAPVEPSSTHINITLWSKDGKPLTTKTDGQGNGYSVLTNALVKGTIDLQRKLSVVFAQSAKDFKRFGYMSPEKKRRDPRVFSPTHIFAVDDHKRIYDGPTIGLWHSNKTVAPGHPETVRLENRMIGANVNYYVAMAGQLAAIEWALDNYTKIIPEGAKPEDFPTDTFEILDIAGIKLAVHKEFQYAEKKYTGWHGPDYTHRKKSCILKHPEDVFDLPRNRREAIERLQSKGNQKFGAERLGESFFRALILQQVPPAMWDAFDIASKADHSNHPQNVTGPQKNQHLEEARL